MRAYDHFPISIVSLLLVVSAATLACKHEAANPKLRDKALRCARSDDQSTECKEAVDAVRWDAKRYEAYQCIHPKACWFEGTVWLGADPKKACSEARRIDPKMAADCETRLVSACEAATDNLDDCDALIVEALGKDFVDKATCSMDVYLEPGDPLENCKQMARDR